MSNTTLVIKAQMGDHEAFAQLVQKHQHYAYGVAVGILSDFDLAQDVVQEAFILAFQDLKKLQDPNRFSGWLHGILRNTAHRALRELIRAHQLVADLSFSDLPLAPSPEISLEEKERHEIVRRALARLSDCPKMPMLIFRIYQAASRRWPVKTHHKPGHSSKDLFQLAIPESDLLPTTSWCIRKELLPFHTYNAAWGIHALAIAKQHAVHIAT